jgi:hypothetical protein
MTDAPRLFISYSHDEEAHKAWVLKLATRLVKNGVDVVLDQWDVRLGGNLPTFMEQGLTSAIRVLAICSATFVIKANEGQGGVGYEKTILTGQLMQDVNTDRIIPIVRNNMSKDKVPTFLLGRRYIDMTDDAAFEASYTELLRDIHGEPVAPRPALGENPFAKVAVPIEPRVSFTSERYVSPANTGTVAFDYSNNNGSYVLGAGDMAFETRWSRSGNDSIYVLNDPSSIRTVAIAMGATKIEDVADATAHDTSSRHRSPHTGEGVIWQNTAGYFLATKITSVKSRGHGFPADEVVFEYVIATDKGTDFGPPTA